MNGYTNNQTSSLRQITSGLKALKHFHLSDLRKVFSLMGKTEKIALSTLALLAALSLIISGRNFYISHTKLAPAFGGSMIEGLTGQPQYINPLLATNDTDQALVRLVFSGLYKLGPNGELVPDLAQSLPQISEDQKSYIINLNPNAVWHNHQPVTAEDVVFTFEAVKNPDYKSPFRAFWLNTSVEKLSDFQVKFVNKDISGPFAYNLTLPILPKNVWQNIDAGSFLLNKNNLEAVGSGPYAIAQINKLPNGKIQSVELKSFSKYYSQKPYLDGLVLNFYDTQNDLLNALRGKEVTAAGLMPTPDDQLTGLDKNYQVYRLPMPQYQTVFFNANEGLTSQKFIRDALTLATDPQALLNEVFKQQRQLPVDPLSKELVQHAVNLDQAKKILDQAGWTLGADGFRHNKTQTLGITLTASDYTAAKLAAQVLQKQWQQLNIQVNLDIKSSKDLMESSLRPRKFQALLYSQKFGSDPDPFFFWHSSQAKDPGLNLTGINDGSLDKFLTDARNTTDPVLRAQKYAGIQNYLSQKNLTIILNQNEYFYFVSPEIKNIGIKTLTDSPARFYDVENWYVKTKRVWK